MKNITKTAKAQIKETATALEVILIITCILTLVMEAFTLKDLTSNISADTISENLVVAALAYPFYLVIQLVALQTFRRIAKQETPFLTPVARNIKIISALIILAGTIPRWLGGVALFIINHGGYVSFIDNQVVVGLLLGLVFACLGAIFDYGCQLQRQDDELL